MTEQKVLFVDDEEGVRVSWDRYLTQSGFAVVTAENVEQAVKVLQADKIDVIVSDLRMPGLSGLEFMSIVKQNYPHIQFIMLTGFGDDDIERAVNEGGGFGYLNKPLNPVVLEDAIKSAFEKLKEISSIEENIQSMLEQTDIPTKYPLRRAFEVMGGIVISPLLGLAFVVFLPAIGFAALIYQVGDSIKYHVLSKDV